MASTRRPGRCHRDGTGLDARIQEMVRGGLSAGFFCVSTDRAIIRRDREAGRIRARRAFEPGESHRDTYARFAMLDPWFADGHILRVLGPADVLRAKRSGRAGAILAAEGADFLEERIDRVQEAHDRGIRSIQLVHYNINAVADIQTEEPRHHGLTPFGAQVIREMNRLGMIVDVAHATEQVTRDVVDITTQPIVLSHTALRRTPRKYTRYIYADHARLIAFDRRRHRRLAGRPRRSGTMDRALQEARRPGRPRAPRHGHGHGRLAQHGLRRL